MTEVSFEGASEAVQEELIGGEDVHGAVIGDCGGEHQRSELDRWCCEVSRC